jgi:hypothetical protein
MGAVAAGRPCGVVYILQNTAKSLWDVDNPREVLSTRPVSGTLNGPQERRC